NRLLGAERVRRIETRGKVGRDKCGKRTNEKRADADDGDISRDDFGRNRRKLIDFARENLDVQCRSEPVTEFVAVTNQRHPESQTRKRSKETDNCPLAKKNPDDLRDVRAERF